MPRPTEGELSNYWFWDWMTRHRVRGARSLRKALDQHGAIDSLQRLVPPTVAFKRTDPPETSELTAGKGIDLTGELGCRHIDCLAKEVDNLFRHAWHYFDRISLPDQAMHSVVGFQMRRVP